MQWSFMFFFNSALLGVGLAMDAFSVSLANGLAEVDMKKRRMCLISGVFALFQAAMPLLGWFCVHSLVSCFKVFEKFIPWISLFLLSFIGGKMLIDAKKEEEEKASVSVVALLIQGVATSIDALSVGFTIADYGFTSALVSALIIAAVTFVICLAGIAIGKKFGTVLSGKASILGGIILIAIGLEIFIEGIL